MSAREPHDIDRQVSSLLDRAPVGDATDAVMRRIAGRTPAALNELQRIVELRRLSAAAALVLGVLFAFGAHRSEPVRIDASSLSAVVALDPTELDARQSTADLLDELLVVEYPE